MSKMTVILTIFEPLFSNHSKQGCGKRKETFMYLQLLKKYYFDMLSLENIISDIEPNVSNKREIIGVNPYVGYDFA